VKVYVASPYSSQGDKLQNVRIAILAGEAVSSLGHTPFIPLLNHFWDKLFPHDEKFWLNYDIKWLEVCDAVLRLNGHSKGADIEVAVAERLNKKIFYSLEDLEKACVKCGESDKMYMEDDVKACMCGWRDYQPEESPMRGLR